MRRPTEGRLTDDLARAAIARIEPTESELVEASLVEARKLWTRRSSSLGYGISEVANFVSPYVVIAATWVVATAADEARKTIDKRIRMLVRRLLNDVEADEVKVQQPHESSTEQELESGARQLLEQLHLAPERAAEVARVVVSELLERQPRQ